MINIAIDGPAGAGKSTIARKIAAEMGYVYVDTGAIYRSIAYACDFAGIKAEFPERVKAYIDPLDIDLEYIDGIQHVYVNGEDVSDRIRTPEVSAKVSAYAALPCVRDRLLGFQRDIAKRQDVVMDGRDIGTVVLPCADVKIFLTASPEVRAKRRFDELLSKGGSPVYEEILAAVNARDKADSTRETAPLKQADDAILLDTSGLDIDAAVKAAVDIIEKAR